MSAQDDIQTGLDRIWSSDFVQKNPKKSYQGYHPDEFNAVKAYVEGGAEPVPWPTTLLGDGLALVERGRRALEPEPPPPPPPPPPVGEGYDFPAKFQVFGVNTEDLKGLDFAVTSFVTDSQPLIARQTNPNVIVVSHPQLDPFNADACYKRGHAWTYGSGLLGGYAGSGCVGKTFPAFPGVNDTLAPNPQGQIRAWQASDKGCMQADGLQGYALFSPPTADLLQRVLFYEWKLGKFAERGLNGLWSDNLVPGNYLHAGWFYGACATAERRAAWDTNLIALLRYVRAKAGGKLYLGGNMIYLTDNPTLRAETNVAMRENIWDYANPDQQPMGRASVTPLWDDLMRVHAWVSTPSIDGLPKLCGMSARVQKDNLLMQRAVAAVACIAGCSFNCYYASHGDTFWPDVTYKNGQRGYLGKPTGPPQLNGNVLSRQFERGAVTYDHATKAAAFT